jgi:TonB family protein
MKAVAGGGNMPDRMRALVVGGLLCLPLAHGVCQDDAGPRVARHRPAANGESSLPHYQLAEAYFEQKNYQQAANEYRAALNGDLEPKWVETLAHTRLGDIFSLTGQKDRAQEEYRQAQQTVAPGRLAVSSWNADVIQKTDPEYTEEARVAQLEGTVVLGGVIDEVGVARDLEVLEPLGLGLDEKAMEAVKQWHFQPKQRATALIAVDFRLSTKQSRWHLVRAQFNNPPGTARPVFADALYPIGAGLGPEAMEEGRLVVAMGRLAAARISFEVDEHGIPARLKILNASEAVWGSEATALVGQWRFTPAIRNGIAVPVVCTVELVWGQRNLDFSNLAQVHLALDTQTIPAPEVFPVSAVKLVIEIPPKYPPGVRSTGLGGTVRVRVLIGTDGRVRKVDAVDGDPSLTEAAVDAVKQWVYQPTLLNGAPVEAITEVDVDVGKPH